MTENQTPTDTQATDSRGLPAAPLFASDDRFSISKFGWAVFNQEGMSEVVMNDARRAGNESLTDFVSSTSTLDLPAFCKSVEGIDLPCVFSINLLTDDMEKPLNANLIPQNLVKFLVDVGNLLRSGVVSHVNLSVGVVRCEVKANE